MHFIVRIFFLITCLSCSSSRPYYLSEINQVIEVQESVLVPHPFNQPMRDYLLKTSFKPNADYLEIGTGSGVLSYILATKNPKLIIVTDINPKAIETVSKHVEKYKIQTIRPSLVKKEHDPYAVLTHKVDYVVSNPPWFKGKPVDMKHSALYDEKLKLLSAIIKGLRKNIASGGSALIELGGRQSIKFCENLLKQEKLKWEVVYSGEYSSKKHPYKIYRITP